jgi:hypothetical protein
MLAVTKRPIIKERLRHIAADLGLPTPAFFGTAADVLESGASAPLLFLDLATCADDPHLEVAVRTWEMYHPRNEIIVFVPLIDREREIKTMFRLALLGAARVMTANDFVRREVWCTVRQAHAHLALQEEIRREFSDAVAATGRRLRAEPIVLQILAHASNRADPRARSMTEDHCRDQTADTRRKALWKRLHDAGQMPASWLLLVFRLLWHTKLYEKGWSSSEIAKFMGFDSPRQFRLMLRRRFNLGMRELNRRPYTATLKWAATICTADYHELASTSVRDLLLPLLETSTTVASPELARERSVDAHQAPSV